MNMHTTIPPARPFAPRLRLVPLHDIADPVATKAFRADLENDMMRRWREAHLRYSCAKAMAHAATYSLLYASEFEPDRIGAAGRERDRLELIHWSAFDILMLVPAPRLTDLRWKQRVRNYDGGSPVWEAAIAADALRLEGGAA